MKITAFERVENDITAILESGTKVSLGWDYILENKPQIDSEYAVEATTVAAVEPEVAADIPSPTI